MMRQVVILLLWLLAATAVVAAQDATPAGCHGYVFIPVSLRVTTETPSDADDAGETAAISERPGQKDTPVGQADRPQEHSADSTEAVGEAAADTAESLGEVVPDAGTPEGATSLVKWVAIVTVVSLAPALAVMVTSFTRIIVVLGLLRQGLAMPQLPPNQILFGLALLMTAVVMAPTIQTLHGEAIAPLMNKQISQDEAIGVAEASVRGFMIRQMESANTADAVYVFLDKNTAARDDLVWADVPTWSLVPGFVLGELKVAFLIGLRILLPFVIIDILVGSVLVSMGMLMLPPVLVATPLKLLMFVLADGWVLIAGTLMSSFS